jgi:hypothetical protein
VNLENTNNLIIDQKHSISPQSCHSTQSIRTQDFRHRSGFFSELQSIADCRQEIYTDFGLPIELSRAQRGQDLPEAGRIFTFSDTKLRKRPLPIFGSVCPEKSLLYF